MRNISFFLVFFLLVASVEPVLSEDKELSLEDLGFSKSDTQSDLNLQLQLEKRSSMLKIHQTLGLVTAIPMITQFFIADDLKNDRSKRNLHAGVGMATAVLYGTTASFAIFAPKPDGVKDKGNTKIHRMLAWVHMPLMILTPILGGIADSQVSKGEKVHGVASLHSGSAGLLLGSYLASMAVMSFNF